MMKAVICATIFTLFLSQNEALADPNSAGSSEQTLSGPTSACEATQNGQATEEQILLCHLYESNAILNQLNSIVNEGLERLTFIQGLVGVNPEQREKRKHEYLRFGKRKHEYLRFGKRKHEYLRFG